MNQQLFSNNKLSKFPAAHRRAVSGVGRLPFVGLTIASGCLPASRREQAGSCGHRAIRCNRNDTFSLLAIFRRGGGQPCTPPVTRTERDSADHLGHRVIISGENSIVTKELLCRILDGEMGRRTSPRPCPKSGALGGCLRGQATSAVTEPSRPSKEVLWPSVTAALPRSTGTSTTTPSRGSTGSARNGR